MKLYYYKDPIGNFGDDLNPWLWERLLPGFFESTCHHGDSASACNSAKEELFIGIGTLLNAKIPPAASKYIFGSGTGYGDLPTISSNWNFYCVRGPLTAERLNLPTDTAITDSAALIREISLPEIVETHKYGFMPHHSSHKLGTLQTIFDKTEINYIDPTKDVDSVLAAMMKCEILITEAMHGAIVADALRIPWIPVTVFQQSVLDFKWHDWCKSLGLEYQPEVLPPIWPSKNSMATLRTIKGIIKEKHLVSSLQKLQKKSKPVLSENSIIQSTTERLKEKLYEFSREHKANIAI